MDERLEKELQEFEGEFEQEIQNKKFHFFHLFHFLQIILTLSLFKFKINFHINLKKLI